MLTTNLGVCNVPGERFSGKVRDKCLQFEKASTLRVEIKTVSATTINDQMVEYLIFPKAAQKSGYFTFFLQKMCFKIGTHFSYPLPISGSFVREFENNTFQK